MENSESRAAADVDALLAELEAQFGAEQPFPPPTPATDIHAGCTVLVTCTC
jgi:hypothetical protein